MNKKTQYMLIGGCIIFVITMTLHSVINKRYNFISMIVVFLSCLPFYFRFENRKPLTREIVVLSIMVAMIIISRLIFAFIPGFKPFAAMIIICGMAFGQEAGFLCGSLSALISNIFFGQGPWTPFQMLAFGIIGYCSGILNKKHWIENKFALIIFGIASGIGYSLFMDIWTVLSLDQVFNVYRYLAVVISAIPFMIIYSFSNVIFLLLLTPIFLKRFERIKWKYGFMEENYLNEGEKI